MIDTQAIRNKILDLAIRGKLTEQLPEDGTVENLYQQIQEKKKRLLEEGKIKKSSINPEITEEDALFELPANWKWVRFGEIITLQSGQDLKASEYSDTEMGIPYLTGASNFDENGELIINRWTCSPRNIALQNDVLISCKGTVGKIAILHIDQAHIARQFMAIRSYLINVEYVKLFMESVVARIKVASKGLIPGIERKDILNLAFPLPPYAEQVRIVGKVSDLFELLRTIDESQNRYFSDYESLKSKIIDAGIRGELTEQLPEDGTAEELYEQIQAEKAVLVKEKKIRKSKPLPEITEDEIPFDIPDNWKWVRFGEIITLQSGQDLKAGEYSDAEIGIPYLTGASNFDENGELIINRWTCSPRNIALQNDVLISCKGTVGKIAILHIDQAHIARQFMAIRSYLINVEYVKLFMESVVTRIKAASKGLIPGIERKDILNLGFPLPPIAEQERIAEKIEELLAAMPK